MPREQAKAWERWLKARLKLNNDMIADALGQALADWTKERERTLRAELAELKEEHSTELGRLLVRVMALEQEQAGRPASRVPGQWREHHAAAA
jgi:hypothetical protein